MTKVVKLFSLLLMVLSPLVLSAADHIVFIHGWQMFSWGKPDTWNNMVDCMTNAVYGIPYVDRDKILIVDYKKENGNVPISDIAVKVWSQINGGFPDGEWPAKIDFVVHSMGGLVLRSMVDQGLLDDSVIGRVVTLASPHYGQEWQLSVQQRNMAYGSEFLWQLANSTKKISPNKVLSIVATSDDVVDEWSAALCDEDCCAIRYVNKSHTDTVGSGICACGASILNLWTPQRKDPVYKLVTEFLSTGSVTSGSTIGKRNYGAILFQVVDGKDKPVEYEARFKTSTSFVNQIMDEGGNPTYYKGYSPIESFPVGVGSVAIMPDVYKGLKPGSYSLEFQASKDNVFSGFCSELIPVKRGRTTVIKIHAENVKPLDFVFLIDSTGSMSDDINSVKASARQLIQQKLGEGARNCRVAIADYRDYPTSPYGSSGDYVFNMRCNFTTNATAAINALNAITTGGGGDTEEAVLTALYSSIVGFDWNNEAAKTIMLMGDAGPHDPEPWSGGHSSSEVLALAKERGVSIYPMLTGYNSSLATTFEPYATETGGKVVSSSSYSSAAEAVQEVIEQSVAANGFETETVNVSETAGSVTVRVFGGNSSDSASVGYQVVAASAINGKDYSAPNAVQRLSWSEGERSYKTITIPIMQDASSSADKFFSIILSDPVNMGLGGINVCRVNVFDQHSTGTPAANRIYVQGLSRQSAGGSVSGSGSYILGAVVTLQATAASGYVFTSWEDGSTSPVRSIDTSVAQESAVNGVATYVASFMKLSDLPLPEITSATSASGKVGETFNWRLDYYSPSAATVTCNGLPSGFTFANGVVSGTATSPGAWTATFTVSNGKGLVNADVTFTFAANPVFTFSDTYSTVAAFAPNGATEVDIPRGVVAIGERAFENCATITSVKIPPTVTSIGKYAFSGCTGLTVAWLPRTLEGHIDSSVFAGCSGCLTVQYYDVATVTFDARGGSLDNPIQKYAVGEPFGELPELHVNRWKFLGWYATLDGDDPISNETIVSGDATYYAMWEADTESIDLGFCDVSGWEQPFFLSPTTNGLTHTTTFEYGDPIYMRYAFMNVAGFAAVDNFVNRFTLNSTTYVDHEWGRLTAGDWGWCGMDCLPDMLQNLPVGMYSLTCVLDAENFVEETDEGNNEISLMFEVVPSTKPNLKIGAVSVSRESIALSESVVVHWRVDNDGVSAAGKTKTAFQIWKYDSTGNTWVLKKTDLLDCNPLAAGAGREYVRSLTGKSLGVGKYIIRVYSDGNGTVRELDESDNYADTYAFVVEKDKATRSTSSVDWQFKKVNKSDPDSFYLSTSSSSKKKATTFKAGQTIYMRCGFWNATKKAVNGSMKVTISLNGGSGIYLEGSYFQKNYYYYNTNRTPGFLQNLPAGKYTLTAVLDSENNWTEKNEKNNVKTISFTVVDTPQIFGCEEFTCALNESVVWPISSEGTVTCGKLPSGLKYSGGAIVGKATKVGTYTVKFTAKNAKGSVSRNIRIIVTNPGFEVSIARISNADSGKPSVNIGSGAVVPMYVGVGQRFTLDATPKKDGVSKSAVSSISVSGLPSGMKYSKGVISGAPTKTGTYTVKIVFKNALKWSETFTWKMTVLPLPEWAKGQFSGEVTAAGGGTVSENFSMTVGSTGKISGKFKLGGTNWTFSASSFAAESTVDGITNLLCTVNAKATVKVGKKNKTFTCPMGFTLVPDSDTSEIASHTEDGFFGDGEFYARRNPGIRITKTAGGTVSMDRAYGQVASGKSVKLTAKPSKGYAFCGWYDENGTLVSQSLAYSATMAENDRFFSAVFKKESELAHPELDWGGETDIMVGVAYETKPRVVAEAAVKIISVTGLPKGLEYKSGKVKGVPTSAKTYTVTVKAALGTNAKKTWTFKMPLYVTALPEWAKGSFNGGYYWCGLNGDTGEESETFSHASLTISSAGKISGKMYKDGAVWTFSAASFASQGFDEFGNLHALVADVTYTSGKTKKKMPLIATAEYVSGCEYLAYRNRWGSVVMADAAAEMVGAQIDLGDGVKLTVGASGKVTAKGKIGSYSASGSTVLCDLNDGSGIYELYIYFAPDKKKKFSGYARYVRLLWNGGKDFEIISEQ